MPSYVPPFPFQYFPLGDSDAYPSAFAIAFQTVHNLFVLSKPSETGENFQSASGDEFEECETMSNCSSLSLDSGPPLFHEVRGWGASHVCL